MCRKNATLGEKPRILVTTCLYLFQLFGHEKVSVLDGGFRKWLLDGYDVTVEVPKVEVSEAVVFTV